MIIISAKGRLISANRLLNGVNDELYLQPYDRRLGFGEGQFQKSEAYANTAITLPLFPGLSDKALKRVINHLAKALDA